MLSRFFLSTTILASTALISSGAVFTLEIGSPPNQVNQNNGTGIISTTGGVTAVSGGGLPAGVSFDLVMSAVGFTAGAAPNSQGGGQGISGGQAASGIDNNFNGTGGTNTVAVEELTFTIANVTAGYQIQMTGFRSNFSADAGANTEFFNIDQGPATPFPSAQSDISITPATSFTIGALDDDGITGSDSRFVVQRLTFDVQPIPEPSAAVLGLLGMALFARRRRR